MSKVPSIPDISSADATEILQAIKMVIDLREGRSGDKLDKVVTFRDLARLGVAKDPAGEVTEATEGELAAEGIPLMPPSSTTDGYNPLTDLTPPPAPGSITAVGSIGVIYVSWDEPGYRNHSYAEVWRSTTDNLGDAQLIGTTDTQFFFDSIGEDQKGYYWIRNVSQADQKGPYSSQYGTAVASIDPQKLINAIAGQVNESSLARSLASRIERIEGNVDVVGSVQNALAVEKTVRETADGQLFAQYTIKIDQNGHVSGFGLASETVDGTTESAFIIRADKFAIVNPSSTGDSLTNSPSTDSVPFAIDSQGRAFLKTAFIGDATITSAKIGDVAANKITAGTIDVALAINGAKIYSGEFYSGGSLTKVYSGTNLVGYSVTNPTVSFANGQASFVTSAFKIKGTSNSATSSAPFLVDANGIVYLDTALIRDGTITTAKIADTIQSTNYAAGANGWIIEKSGDAEFNNLTARGDITANHLRAADGTFTGTLSAVGGTFTGELKAATGTFSGSLSAGVVDLTKLVGVGYRFEQAGTFYVTVPSAEQNSMRLTLVGGGGGGGGGTASYDEGRKGGGGGGGGGLTIITHSGLSAYTQFTIEVGSGGAGAPSSTGNRSYGGDSTAGGDTVARQSGTSSEYGRAGGGGAGTSPTRWTSGGLGGAGGSGSTTNGVSGQNPYTYTTGAGTFASPTVSTQRGGDGGESGGKNGSGGTGGVMSSTSPSSRNGNNGSLYGGGGGGGAAGYNNSGCGGGGNGARGLAVVEFFNPNGVVIRKEWTALLTALQTQGIRTS